MFCSDASVLWLYFVVCLFTFFFFLFFFFFQAEDGIRVWSVTGVQTCALPISPGGTRRFGPANDTGLARSEKIGSVRNVTPSMRTRNVEWPIHVRLGFPSMAAGSWGTRGARPSRPTSDVHALRVRKGRMTPRPGRGREPPGFANTSPSRGAPAGAGRLVPAITRTARNATARRTGRYWARRRGRGKGLDLNDERAHAP